jgi:hypothetical protein
MTLALFRPLLLILTSTSVANSFLTISMFWPLLRKLTPFPDSIFPAESANQYNRTDTFSKFLSVNKEKTSSMYNAVLFFFNVFGIFCSTFFLFFGVLLG